MGKKRSRAKNPSRRLKAKTKVKIKSRAKSRKTSKKSGVSVRTLKQYYPTLKRLATTSKSSRISSILNRIPDKCIDVICECAYNAVYSKNISKRSLARLKKIDPNDKQSIRKLVALPSNKRYKERKRLLHQAGGSIAAIIAAVLPMLLNLFKKS